jgi:hypothetical protein
MVLGIMIEPLGKLRSRTYVYMSLVGRRMGITTMFFSPSDVNISKGSIIGYHFDPKGSKWRKVLYPQIPKVIYNQIRTRAVERSPKYRRVSRFFQRKGSTVFNPRFLCKVDVNRCLAADENLIPYIPETHILKGKSKFRVKKTAELIRKYQTVFVKPVNGSLGDGIIRIKRHGESAFLLQSQHRSRKKTISIKNNSHLLHKFKLLTRGRRYLAQQGLDLMGPYGGPVDFRILFQKDISGKWQHTFTFAKVTKRGAIVSNVAAGASVRNADLVLASMVDDPEAVKLLMHSIAFATAEAVDKKLGPIGELGIDIGIDSCGHPWIIEANSKFSRKVFPRKIHILSIHRVMQYARYLFNIRLGGEQLK